jgi:hypothetical protein
MHDDPSKAIDRSRARTRTVTSGTSVYTTSRGHPCNSDFVVEPCGHSTHCLIRFRNDAARGRVDRNELTTERIEALLTLW